MNEQKEKFNALFEELSQLKLTQMFGDWVECLPDDIWNTHFRDNFKELKHGLDINRHRWYETSISAIEIYGEILGVRFISNLFSESMDYEGCGYTLQFLRMKEVKVISYEIDQ